MKYATKTTLIFLLCLSCNLNAQIFTLDGGYQNFNAQTAGTPNQPNRTVLVRQAPSPDGNVNQIRTILNRATIPDVVIQSRLTEGPLSGYITQMPAVISMANKLNGRPNTKSTNGAVVINSGAVLNQNRNRLRNNATETFVFRGNVNVNEPIIIGSNKTIWIDGKVTYTGPVRPLANTDELSPIPIIRDGLFRIVGKTRVSINGTKRGLVDCRTRIPFAYALNSNRITVRGNEVINGFNTVFMHQSQIVTIEDNFFYNSVRRGMHIIAVNNASIKNNLVYANHLDGIDIDAFTVDANVQFNVIAGATHRFMLWTEIDARDNVMDNNVAIVLEGRRGKGSGALQENGTEESRRGVSPFQGSRNNVWKHNNIFYAQKAFDGVVMRKDRFIQFNTITFDNNYVWTVEGNVKRHNPKPQSNITKDVRFITLQTPANGTKQDPTDEYPRGLPTFFSTAPGNLTTAQIVSTPNLFGGGGGNTPPVDDTSQLINNGTFFIGNPFNSQRLVGNNGNNVLMANESTNNSQKWNFRHLGDNNYVVKNAGNNRYLEVAFANCADAANVTSWTAANSNHQKWNISKSGNNFVFKPLHCTTRAMDRNAGAINANAILYNFSPSNNNQKWTITSTTPGNGQLISDGNYHISSTANNQRLHINSGNNSEMINPSSNSNQQWAFIHLGDNNYTVKNVGENRFLEVPFALCDNFVNVASWTGAGRSHQKWNISKSGNDFIFKPLHCLEKAMDRTAGAFNANAQLYNFSNTNRNQQWNITPIAPN